MKSSGKSASAVTLRQVQIPMITVLLNMVGLGGRIRNREALIGRMTPMEVPGRPTVKSEGRWNAKSGFVAGDAARQTDCLGTV